MSISLYRIERLFSYFYNGCGMTIEAAQAPLRVTAAPFSIGLAKAADLPVFVVGLRNSARHHFCR